METPLRRRELGQIREMRDAAFRPELPENKAMERLHDPEKGGTALSRAAVPA